MKISKFSVVDSAPKLLKGMLKIPCAQCTYKIVNDQNFIPFTTKSPSMDIKIMISYKFWAVFPRKSVIQLDRFM